MIKVKTIIGNLPLIGRIIFPLKNKYSIFHEKGLLYSSGSKLELSAFPNPKIVIIGLPKSGNTWLQNLVSKSLDMEIIHVMRDRGKSGVGMTHKAFGRSIFGRKDFARALYIVRDVRDIVCSYYPYSQTEDYHKNVDPNCHFDNISDFYYKYFLAKLVDRYDWFNHCEDYISHGLPIVRYEDLIDEPFEQLRSLFERLNLKVDDDKIKDAVEKSSFKNLSKGGLSTHREVPKSHFRKGGYGNYKEELPAEVINDMNERFGEYLKRWGYQ